MLRFWIVAGCCCMIAGLVNAQLNDQFLDTNFSQNPCWVGDTASWKVNSSFELQSYNMVANTSFYLSTTNTRVISTQWDIDVRLSFNTSSVNYADIYLVASSANISSSTTVGYFVRLGGTQDEISLYRKSENGSILKIIDGTDGVLNVAASQLKLRVVCDGAHRFMLFRDLSNTGSSFELEGQAVDSTFLSSEYFGILIKQSTASFFQKHFFTNIRIRDFVPDTIPPRIVSAVTLDSNKLEVLFDEPIQSTSAIISTNFQIAAYAGNIDSIQLDANNNRKIRLFFNQPFLNGFVYTLVVSGVADCFSNILNHDSVTFYYYKPHRFDLVIHEFMADPTPSSGLPEVEWIELRNTSSFPINLEGWKISDASSVSGPMPSFVLKPDSLVIVCSSTAYTSLRVFGNVIGLTGFPSLDNEGDLLCLLSSDSTIIYFLKYDMSWYRNDLKKLGGWSLEMIDAKNPCAGKENWKESEHDTGGTPSTFNTVENFNRDEQAPMAQHGYAMDSLHVVLVMNEPLQEASVLNTANYHFNHPEIIVRSAKILPPLFNQICLTLSLPLARDIIYHLSVENLCDCAGNISTRFNNIRLGLAEKPDSLDLVINEILFNPSSEGSDYVELYNRSNHIIDASKIFMANRNSIRLIDNIVPIITTPYLVFPGDFLLITENKEWVKSHFSSVAENTFLSLTSLPSMNDDGGSVLVLNAQGAIIDQLDYQSSWHFKLLNDQENVSLERISQEAPSNDCHNWHSAAAPAYGSPGFKNTQHLSDFSSESLFSLSAKLISPNNDGQDDYLQILYNFPSPGFLLSVSVFDEYGRLVKFLQQNYLCATSGSFMWDGLGQKNQPLASGIYIIYFEAFNIKGQKVKGKKAIVLNANH